MKPDRYIAHKRRELRLSPEEILARFGADAKCHVHYRNNQEVVKNQTLGSVRLKNATSVVVLFDEPRSYYVGKGESGDRPGVKVIVG